MYPLLTTLKARVIYLRSFADVEGLPGQPERQMTSSSTVPPGHRADRNEPLWEPAQSHAWVQVCSQVRVKGHAVDSASCVLLGRLGPLSDPHVNCSASCTICAWWIMRRLQSWGSEGKEAGEAVGLVVAAKGSDGGKLLAVGKGRWWGALPASGAG